jgi:hypothetical protein
MNEHKPLKLDVAPMPAQGTAFDTTSHKGKGKKVSSRTKYISPEAQTKVINAHKKAAEDDDDEKSSASVK